MLEDVLATRVLCTACVRRRTHLLARLIFRGLLYLPLPNPNLVLWIRLLLNHLRLVQYNNPCNPTVVVAFSTVWHTGAHPKIRAAAFRHYRGAYSTLHRTRAAAASSQRQQSLQNDLQLLSLSFPHSFPSIQTFRSVRRAVRSGEWRTTGFFDCESNALPGSVNAD